VLDPGPELIVLVGGVELGEVPTIPLVGGLTTVEPGAAGAGLAVPAAPPYDTPEGVDAAPPIGTPVVALELGTVVTPVDPYPTPVTWFVFQSCVEGALVAGTLETKVCARLGS
jgi:hypothetical protein